MINDEELKKIQWNAQKAIEYEGKGPTITMAMDPAVMFAMTTELLKLRRHLHALQTAAQQAVRRAAEAGNHDAHG